MNNSAVPILLYRIYLFPLPEWDAVSKSSKKVWQSVQTCPLPAISVEKPVLVRVKTAQSRHVDTQHVRHTTRYAAAAICNFLHFRMLCTYCFLISFVCSWHLSQKRSPGSAQHSLVLVWKRENKGERETPRERMCEGKRCKVWRRRCGTSRKSLAPIKEVASKMRI